MSSPKEDIPDIEKPEQNAFVKFYKSLPETTDGTLRFFERDANQKRYYSVHAENAKYVAKQVYKTTTVIKYWGGDEALETTTVNSAIAESFMRDALVEKQLRIEIWSSNRGQWQLSRKASPGNLQQVEDLLFSNSNLSVAPIVMAVKIGTGTDRVVGAAFVDTTTKQLGVSEFADNELYSNFESLVIQLGVKECIVPESDDYEITKLKSILDRCRISVTTVKKADYNPKDIVQDLNRLLKGELSIAVQPAYEKKNAMGACACIVKYLQLLSDESNFGHYELKHHDLSQYMRLDAAALSALNLMPNPQDGSNQTMNLYGLLNKCKTAQGARLLMQWLKQPLLDVHEIVRRQDLVQILYDNSELRQSIQEDHLKTVPDIQRIAKRFDKGKASLQDVVRIYQVIIRLPALLTCLEMQLPEEEALARLVHEFYLNELKVCAAKLLKLQEMVEATIDLDAVEHHEFIIKPDLDEGLTAIHSRIDDARNQMNAEHRRVGTKLGLELEKKLKLEKHHIYGYCFRVTRTDASALRNKSEYIEYATQKAGVYFATSTLKDLSSTWTDLSKEYDRRQADLIKEVIEIVATYCPILESLSGVLAHLDVIVSMAHVSIMTPIPYVRPTVKKSGGIDLVAARHPCLEAQDDVQFIANDIKMVKGESEFQIITGPNMGGKSTYIRQIGVIMLLAQIGCFVPCQEATVGIVDCILARVGAGDSQLKGVSTFMAEMLETATILKTATESSLIIIDELGRGTSTYDGFGLAWAISEYIATHIRAFCLFATHFHELTALADKLGHVQNLNVAVDMDDQENRITLLYKVEKGICDQSFGIHVAELAQFPGSVVQLAKRKVAELEDPVDGSAAKRQASAEDESQALSEIVQALKPKAGEGDDALVQAVLAIRERHHSHSVLRGV